MNSVDEDHLATLRRCNPQSPLTGGFRDAPLDERAERELTALLRGASSRPPRRSRARRQRARLGVLWAAPVAAAAVAAVMAVVLIGSGPPPNRPDPAPTQLTVASIEAAVVMHRAATTASAQPGLAPEADQFWYTRSLVAVNTGPLGGLPQPGPLVEREVWLPQSAVDGWIVEGEDAFPLAYASSEQPAITYARMADLPTDPQELLRVLRDDAVEQGFDDVDFGTFLLAGDWLTTGMAPPEVVSALYRATATLPGVVVVEGATDAAGRTGLGLSLENRSSGLRYEWVLDEATSTILGANTYLVEDSSQGPGGMRTNTTAVLARGIADAAGEAPRVEVPVP